ncbi:DUF4876 domain-containing protein [Prolixibacteraceae bacterium JC049]|nr:DUF4876 domain-containing protein [Prolixibacteraceae bacterium JC049]
MNRLIYFVFFAMVALWTGCSDDNTIAPGNVSVTVNYPESFSSSASKANIEVKIKGVTNTELEYKGKTNEQGVVVFSDLIVGTYKLVVDKSFTAEEAKGISGYSNEIILNASKNDVVVVSENTINVTVDLKTQKMGGLLIKQMKFSGTEPRYFKDEFVEIYNNANHDIYLDGLCLGAHHARNVERFDNDMENTYVGTVWQIPGTGKEHLLKPGESVIIAETARDHTVDNDNSLDLSGAKFETFVEGVDDIDNTKSTNLIVKRTGHSKVTSSFVKSMYQELHTKLEFVIFRVDDFDALKMFNCEEVGVTGNYLFTQIPNDKIIDAYAVKHFYYGVKLTTAVDKGPLDDERPVDNTAWIRKVSSEINNRKILKNTNDSSEDFELINKAVPGAWKQ